MTVNIVDGFEKIYTIMKTCIETEMQEGGILEDVETFIPIYHSDRGVDEPCIWMTQHPTTANRQADISQTMELITPFEFDCVVYEVDMEDSEAAGQNLANRVILAILRNFLQVQRTVTGGKRIIKNIELETYYPAGEVTIQGKSERVPATGVILNVRHVVNWVACCRQIQTTPSNTENENQETQTQTQTDDNENNNGD